MTVPSIRDIHGHTREVLAQAKKILALKEYGLHIKDLALRFNCSPRLIERALREARKE